MKQPTSSKIFAFHEAGGVMSKNIFYLESAFRHYIFLSAIIEVQFHAFPLTSRENWVKQTKNYFGQLVITKACFSTHQIPQDMRDR